MNSTKESNAITAKRKLLTVRVLATVGIIAAACCLLLIVLGWVGYIDGPIGITPVMLTFLQAAAPGVDPSVGHGVGFSRIPLAHHAAAMSWLFVAAIVAFAFKALARYAAE